MWLSFSKYVGCGNDFILFDNRSGVFPSHDGDLIRQLCHRQYGIGADGIILLEESEKADFAMRIFNADGGEAEMCGNGIRCLMKFIQELGISLSSCLVETMCRTHRLTISKDLVSVDMGAPTEVAWNIPIEMEANAWTIQFLNTGVPHAILFMKEIESFDLASWGPKFRYHSQFHPQGTNFSVATFPVNGKMSIRTYERGVEGETLACGTGATAAALAGAYLYDQKSPITVQTRLQEKLVIEFQRQGDLFSNVTMSGPSTCTYRGEVDISNFSNRKNYVCKK